MKRRWEKYWKRGETKKEGEARWALKVMPHLFTCSHLSHAKPKGHTAFKQTKNRDNTRKEKNSREKTKEKKKRALQTHHQDLH